MNMSTSGVGGDVVAAAAVGWTARRVAVVVTLFFVASVGEIGGCYAVWKTFKLGHHWGFAVVGALALFAYACVFCVMPMPGDEAFGRLLAIYGGFFIVASYAFGRVVDGFKPDVGDYVGCAVALAGVLVCMLWPRASAS